MAKVTLNPASPTPSQRLLETERPVEVVDALGRKIKLERPDVLSEFRLIEAIGPAAQNIVYLGMVTPMTFVREIDGEAIVEPQTKGEIEALIKRLGRDGVKAVMEGVSVNFSKEAEAPLAE